ncbi:uncharacterized protein LOC134701680 [Mytilus trossulus]|uniref:uncharacterized protein LOC134701680 n=1 Tax=Mytilus trossulus TaxID=6551 RepID=UPI0030052235
MWHPSCCLGDYKSGNVDDHLLDVENKLKKLLCDKCKTKDELIIKLQALQLSIPLALDKSQYAKIGVILELTQEVQKTFDLTHGEDADIYKQSSKCLPPRSHTVSDKSYQFNKPRETGEPSACRKTNITSDKIVSLLRTKELLSTTKDEILYPGHQPVNDKFISSRNETDLTADELTKDGITKEDETKTTSLVIQSNETVEYKTLQHSKTSISLLRNQELLNSRETVINENKECGSFKTYRDETRGRELGPENDSKCLSSYEDLLKHGNDVISNVVSLRKDIQEYDIDVVFLHPDRPEYDRMAEKVLEHLMKLAPDLKGDLSSDVFIPGESFFQLEHLFKRHYIFVLITPYYSLQESNVLRHQVEIVLNMSLRDHDKKGRVIPVLMEKNIDLPSEFASIKPFKFYLAFSEEQKDKKQHVSRISELFLTKLYNAHSCIT